MTMDASCNACPPAALRTDLVRGLQKLLKNDAALLAAASGTDGRSARQWIGTARDASSSAAPVVGAVPGGAAPPYECALRCANNYAWINVSTGLSPWPSAAAAPLLLPDAPELFCVPCASAFVMGSAQIPLFSYWNGSLNNSGGALPLGVGGGSRALRSMQGVAGGCYLCQSYHDVEPTSTALCELQPGYTGDNQGLGTPTTITTLDPNTTTVSVGGEAAPVTPGVVGLIGVGNNYGVRRLLQLSSSSQQQPPATMTVVLAGVGNNYGVRRLLQLSSSSQQQPPATMTVVLAGGGAAQQQVVRK
jgi:hypothetical protein